MPLHTGKHFELDGVRIGPPNLEAIAGAPRDSDIASSVDRWLSRARGGDDVHYFAVYEGETLVGQIFLHDIDRRTGEALVGYHLLERRFRGRGLGTTMLALLQRYVRAETDLLRPHFDKAPTSTYPHVFGSTLCRAEHYILPLFSYWSRELNMQCV